MTDPANANRALSNDNIVADTPCRRCGYNLRGLSKDGQCPECGAPIKLSVGGDVLRYSDPNWLRRLRRGISLLLWFFVACVSLLVVAMTLPPVSGAIGPPVLLRILGALIGGMYVWGVFEFTAPEPGATPGTTSGMACRVARIAAVIGLLDGVALSFRSSLNVTRAVQTGWTVVNYMAVSLGVIGLYALAQRVQRFCDRLPDGWMSGRAASLNIAIVAASIFVIVFAGLTQLAASFSPIIQVFGCIVLVLAIPMSLVLLDYLVLLIQLSGRLKETMEAATRFWEPADTSPNDQKSS
jgi:hypothetical protein